MPVNNIITKSPRLYFMEGVNTVVVAFRGNKNLVANVII